MPKKFTIKIPKEELYPKPRSPHKKTKPMKDKTKYTRKKKHGRDRETTT